ncbi:hypothetical protein C8R48DRAFT_672012 [Suillus tomentosus]|nr:hypothetical protein C8R48DRAFT_672012 [Suillus tomentosus]
MAGALKELTKAGEGYPPNDNGGVHGVTREGACDTSRGVEGGGPERGRAKVLPRVGPYWATETQTAQAQVDSGKVISAATSVNINNSEKTTSTKANNVYHFSPLPRHQAAIGLPEV